MALETLRAARKEIGEKSGGSAGAGKKGTSEGPILDEAPPLPHDVPPGLRARLLGRHGTDAAAIAALGEAFEPAMGTTALWSELRWAARDEGVVHLDDLLLRRARLGILATRGGIGQMSRIRSIAQPELGWDDARWASEEAAYINRWKNDYAISPDSL